MALYMSWAGLSGLGYLDIVLAKRQDIALAVVVTLTHIMSFATVFGTFFHFIVRADENTLNQKALLKAIDQFSADRRLPAELSARIVAHYSFQHSKQSSSTVQMFEQLPRSLRTEVASEQYRTELDNTSAFYGCSGQFSDDVVLHLRERFVRPREVVFRSGDGALEISWCVGGALHVRSGDAPGDALIQTIRADLGPGQVVGEVAFFLNIAQPHSVQATAAGEVTLVYLTAAAFEEIVARYPEEIDVIVQAILRRFGLDKSGGDHAIAAAALADISSDKGAQEAMEALRATIRLVIIERNQERLSQMFAAVVQGDTEVVRNLVKRGFDLDIASYDGLTSLTLAASEGNALVVSLLVDLGANLNAVDRWGVTPLEAAVDNRHLEAAEALKSAGAELALSQQSARMREAVRCGDLDLLRLLVSMGVDVSGVDYASAAHLRSRARGARAVPLGPAALTTPNPPRAPCPPIASRRRPRGAPLRRHRGQ
jgi:hyperpolarization activated cyclic nucleotide-gated potassium channel 4